jgi:hypothetical protein
MGRRGDGQQKREGYGRFPNSLVRSGAWAKFHPKMRAVYGALMGLLDRTMNFTYKDSPSPVKVAYGYPTTRGIAKASGVRLADVSRVTELLERLGLIIKKSHTIGGKPRIMYILTPPDHYMSIHCGDTCSEICQAEGETWGLTRKSTPTRKMHEYPPWRQLHESPRGQHITHLQAENSPIPSQDLRRPASPRSAARLSQKSTTRRKSMADRLLPALFAALPPETWEQRTAELQADGHRLRDIEEAKQTVAGVRPFMPPFDQGKRRCQGLNYDRSECVVRAQPGSAFCWRHLGQAQKPMDAVASPSVHGGPSR